MREEGDRCAWQNRASEGGSVTCSRPSVSIGNKVWWLRLDDGRKNNGSIKAIGMRASCEAEHETGGSVSVRAVAGSPSRSKKMPATFSNVFWRPTAVCLCCRPRTGCRAAHKKKRVVCLGSFCYALGKSAQIFGFPQVWKFSKSKQPAPSQVAGFFHICSAPATALTNPRLLNSMIRGCPHSDPHVPQPLQTGAASLGRFWLGISDRRGFVLTLSSVENVMIIGRTCFY